MKGWRLVVFSADCDEDGNCPHCGIDYADCGCPGPTQDDLYDYKEAKGVMYARRKTCRWFAKCANPATGTTPHSVLGEVPTCDRCHEFATGARRCES